MGYDVVQSYELPVLSEIIFQSGKGDIDDFFWKIYW